jgi:hypothetical protein
MSKKLTGILTAFVIAFFLAASASAQDGGGNGKDSKFYNFEDMMVDGELQTPDMVKTQARGKAKFKRLLDLKKSFLPKVQETTESDALE